MIETKYSFRVNYSETDQMGVVHHSNYARYYENARWDAFKQMGFDYADIEHSGIIMPVIDMHIKYLKPAYYNEELCIKTIIVKNPTVKMRFCYEMTNQSDELISTAEIDLAFVSKTTGRPCHPPESLTNIV